MTSTGDARSGPKPFIWIAVGLLAVLVVSQLTVGAAELSYDHRGNGCLELTAESKEELERATAFAAGALAIWNAVTAWLLARRWKRVLEVPDAAGLCAVVMALVLSVAGLLAFPAHEVEQALLAFTSALVCVVIGGGLVVYGLLSRRRTARPVSAVASTGFATIVWVLAATALPLLWGGSGEVLNC